MLKVGDLACREDHRVINKGGQNRENPTRSGISHVCLSNVQHKCSGNKMYTSQKLHSQNPKVRITTM